MQNKHNSPTLLSTTGMEFLILLFVFLNIAGQIILGKSHILCQLLQAIYAPAMVFLAGIYTYHHGQDKTFFYKKAFLYTSLFLFFGLCNQVLLNHKLPFQSVIRLLTMVKIPTPSEMFFTTAILFFCCAFLSNYTNVICRKWKLFSILGILSILMSLFPSDIFGYPIIGVFTGCNTYNCIALLPYFGFYIAGILSAKNSVGFNKKILLISILLTVGSTVLIRTPIKPIALILFGAFPVYALILFSKYCTLYHNLVNLISKTIQWGSQKLKQWYQDFSQNKRSVLPLYFIVYTGMFLIMAACVFFSFIEYDNSIAWMHDAISQYIPRIHYFINYVHECFSQLLKGSTDFSSYTFRAGLGNAVPLSYEPVYWLFSLFDSSNVEFAYNFITIFRFYLSGLSASIFFLYYKKGYFESLIGSMLYTFCGFAIYAGVLHAHFIGPMIFLPLLILSTEEIFRKKRWYLCTIFVALALPANYYFIYMSTLAMGIYYVFRFLFTKDRQKKNWKYFLTTTCTFAGAYLLGVVIGNISLFTSFASYVNSARSGNSEIATLSFFYYKDSWLVRFFTYFISAPATPGAWLKLGFIPLSYIAVVLLFTRKEKKLLRALFVLSAVFSIFPIAAYVFGGFSTITNRWCYILALLVSYITVQAIPELHTLSRHELKVLLLAIVPYGMIILMNRDYRAEYTLCSLALLFGTYILVLCMNKDIRLIGQRTSNTALVVLCCMALTLNAYYQYLQGVNTKPDSFAKQGKVISEISDTPMKVFDNYPDDSFYRVSTAEIPRKNLSSSLVMNYNSIATFSSTISGTIIDYNVQMGNTAWNLVQLGGFDNRTFMNALACVKYYALTDKEVSRLPYGYEEIDTKEVDGENIHIYQNKHALPLAYCYDSVISEETLEKYNPAEKQEILLKSAAVKNPDETTVSTVSTPSLTAKEVKVIDIKTDGIEVKGDTAQILQEGATLTLSFDGLENAETYLLFDGSCNPGKNNDECIVSMKFQCGDYKRSYDFRSSNHTYDTGQESYLFNLGYRKETVNSCTITFKDKGSFTFDSLKVYCQPMDSYASDLEKLTENILENIEVNNNTITGNICTDKDKFLVFSIPYQKGWTAYVDGKEVDIEKANLMYMGINLKPGEHEIRLHFERPGVKASLCLSAIGILIFIIALIIRHRRIKIRK